MFFRTSTVAEKLAFICSFLFFSFISFNAYAARNPGQSAQNCVDASVSGSRLTFTNNCSAHVFVIYCGGLTYSKETCGSRGAGKFYTHSMNLNVGENHDVSIKGQYQWAACIGRISFGNDGEYKDFPDGSYQCLVR